MGRNFDKFPKRGCLIEVVYYSRLSVILITSLNGQLKIFHLFKTYTGLVLLTIFVALLLIKNEMIESPINGLLNQTNKMPDRHFDESFSSQHMLALKTISGIYKSELATSVSAVSKQLLRLA